MNVVMLLCAMLADLQRSPSLPDEGLRDLAARHGTDKLQHGFIDVYEPHFAPRKSSIHTLVEMGVLFGSSIKMWRDWLPQSKIIGIDNFSGIMGAWRRNGRGRPIPNHTKFLMEANAGLHGDRVVVMDRDLSSKPGLQRVVADLQAYAPLDVIIDDASHSNHDQLTGLASMLPLLRPGGLYVIEDIHTSLENGYDLPPGSPETALQVLQRFNRTSTFQSRFVTEQEARYIVSRVETTEIFCPHKRKLDRTSILTTKGRVRE